MRHLNPTPAGHLPEGNRGQPRATVRSLTITNFTHINNRQPRAGADRRGQARADAGRRGQARAGAGRRGQPRAGAGRRGQARAGAER